MGLRLGSRGANSHMPHHNFGIADEVKIMDPKMDSGCLEEGETIGNGFDPGQALLPEEVLWIIDELLCREAAWKEGRTLAQTLFTSVHIDHLLTQRPKPDEAPTFQTGEAPQSRRENENSPWTHLVLRAYCIGVIISSAITIEMIASQVYYEEEDFNTNTYNRKLLDDVADETSIRLLDQAISWVHAARNGKF